MKNYQKPYIEVLVIICADKTLFTESLPGDNEIDIGKLLK